MTARHCQPQGSATVRVASLDPATAGPNPFSRIRELESLCAAQAAEIVLLHDRLRFLRHWSAPDFVGGADPVQTIIRRVAAAFDISPADVIGKCRRSDLVVARHVAIYAVREILSLPYVQIAAYFGHKDHGSMIHALQSVAERRDSYPAFALKLKTLMTALRAPAAPVV